MQRRSPTKILTRLALTCILAAPCFCVFGQSGTETTPTRNEPNAERSSIRLQQTVNEAFRLTHDGWSSDEVILDDTLFTAFIGKCNELLPDHTAEEFAWTLLNLRKSGKLETKSSRRKNTDVDAVVHIAEIAARSVCDRFRVSTDRVMVDPDKRTAFNSVAEEIDPDVDLYLVRKAAFKLRKTRRLKPELITRIADWGRVVQTHSAAKIAKTPELIPERPGIYIFRDPTGYLYIGQTANLRLRLTTHLDQSHSQSLAKYLNLHGAKDILIEIHAFDPESRAKETTIRRAYESELIASRKPRFNIQP